MLGGVVEGRAATVLLAAGGGIGASRFLTEAERRVAPLSTPFLVLRGTAMPATTGTAYRPICDALGPLLELADDAVLTTLVGNGAEELGRMIPTLEPRLAALSLLPAKPSIAAPGRRQARLFEAILGVLGRLAERQPVILALEDLQVADAATRSLVTFLARITRADRLCLIASYRPDELTYGHPLHATLRDIADATRPAERISLAPLDRDELGDLVVGIEGDRPSASTLLLVAEHSAGSPLMAEELLAARREVPGGRLSGSFEALVLARLSQRSAAARHVVRILAAAGRTLSQSEVTAVAEALEPGRSLDAEVRAGVGEALSQQLAVAIPELSDAPGFSATDGAVVTGGGATRSGRRRAPSGPNLRMTLRHELIARAVVHATLPDERRARSIWRLPGRSTGRPSGPTTCSPPTTPPVPPPPRSRPPLRPIGQMRPRSCWTTSSSRSRSSCPSRTSRRSRCARPMPRSPPTARSARWRSRSGRSSDMPIRSGICRASRNAWDDIGGRPATARAGSPHT